MAISKVVFVFWIGFTMILAENDHNYCSTPDCIAWSKKVLQKMNQSVNPCDNFYEFACGNFVKNTVIPDDKNTVNTFSTINDKLQSQLKGSFEEPTKEDELKLFKNVKTYYKDCIDTDKIEKLGLEVIKDKLKKYGGWPVSEGDKWSNEFFNWTKVIPKLKKQGFNSNYLLTVSVGTDLRNNSKRIIYVDTPSVMLSKDILGQDTIMKAYFDFMVDVAIAFGADPETARQELKESLDLEISLANNTFSSEEARDINKMYNTYTIYELRSNYPSIPWLKYINNNLPKEVQVNYNEKVIVTLPSYVKFLEETLKHTLKRVLANFIFWHVIEESANFLTTEIQNIYLQFNQVALGIKELPPRWKICVGYVRTMFPNIVGSLYVRQYFNPSSKEEVLYIVKYIKNEFEKILKENHWMDDNTKSTALKKLNATELHLGYPDELLDDRILMKTYGNMQIIPGNFFDTNLSILRFYENFNLKRLRQPVNRSEWISHANVAVVNAYYSENENSLIFPAGILQDQFFDLGRPRYMNFGSFGLAIGHEMTHGFDDVGRQFDADGNLKEWWKKETEIEFLKKADCIVKQYGNYTVPEVTMTINGNLTLGENIADNGGANEAFLAYQTWQKENKPEPLLPDLNFTQNQMFWISLAQDWCENSTTAYLQMQILTDVHSPSEYRVSGPLRNLEGFSRDFKCPPGSPMNPTHKCRVW